MQVIFVAATLILKTCNIQYILNNVTYFFFRTRLLFGRIFNKVDYFFLNLLLTPFFSLLLFSSILLFFAFLSVVPPLQLHFLSLLLLIFSSSLSLHFLSRFLLPFFLLFIFLFFFIFRNDFNQYLVIQNCLKITFGNSLVKKSLIGETSQA